MSYDKTTQEYHLTPNGWVAGTFSVYGVPQAIVEPPVDRVETWEQNMVQSSSFSKGEYNWDRVWVTPNSDEKDLDILRRRYPRPKNF